MKHLPAILIAASLMLAACAVDGSRGGGSFDGSDATPVAAAPTETPVPTEMPAATACAPEMLNLGDPALWVEGSTVVIAIGITDAALLPARLTSDNGLDKTLQTLDEVSRGGSYGPLDIIPSPTRTFILTLANGDVCTAMVTIISATPTPAATDTPVPTETPTATPTPLPTLTPTLAPAALATPTRMVTSTPGMAPVTGGEEESQPPKSPIDQIWELIQIFLGGG